LADQVCGENALDATASLAIAPQSGHETSFNSCFLAEKCAFISGILAGWFGTVQNGLGGRKLQRTEIRSRGCPGKRCEKKF